MKSEKLRKLEAELADLNQWMNLGLVPKREIEKYTEDIKNIERKIEEEKTKLKTIKETEDVEEIISKRKTSSKVYSEPQTLPDIEVGQQKTETEETQDTEILKEKEKYKEEATVIEELEEDPFSDKNRWKRGILEDPDADSW